MAKLICLIIHIKRQFFQNLEYLMKFTKKVIQN